MLPADYFTNSLQYRNANICNFILAVQFKIDNINKVGKLKISNISFHIYEHHMVQIMKETAHIWLYKFSINAIVAKCVCLWRCPVSWWLRDNINLGWIYISHRGHLLCYFSRFRFNRVDQHSGGTGRKVQRHNRIRQRDVLTDRRNQIRQVITSFQNLNPNIKKN